MKEVFAEITSPILRCAGATIAMILGLVGFVIGVPSLLVYRFSRWLVELGNLIIADLD